MLRYSERAPVSNDIERSASATTVLLMLFYFTAGDAACALLCAAWIAKPARVPGVPNEIAADLAQRGCTVRSKASAKTMRVAIIRTPLRSAMQLSTMQLE